MSYYSGIDHYPGYSQKYLSTAQRASRRGGQQYNYAVYGRKPSPRYREGLQGAGTFVRPRARACKGFDTKILKAVRALKDEIGSRPSYSNGQCGKKRGPGVSLKAKYPDVYVRARQLYDQAGGKGGRLTYGQAIKAAWIEKKQGGFVRAARRR